MPRGILKNFRTRPAASPQDVLVHIERGVALTGGAATVRLEGVNDQVRASYFICKEAAFTADGDLTVNTTAIGATDTVTVVAMWPANELPY